MNKAPRDLSTLNKNVIIRTRSAGVFHGLLVETDLGQNGQVRLKNARRLWYWDGAASLSQLSQEGVKKPKTCKFPAPVPEIVLTETIEIIPTTEAADKSIEEVKPWAQ